jgi:hypothetical protein
MPLIHLIALIINAHPARQQVRSIVQKNLRSRKRLARPDIDLERPACFGSFRRRAVKQPTYGTEPICMSEPICIGQPLHLDAPICIGDAISSRRDFHRVQRDHVQCSEMRIGRDVTSRSTLGAILPLHDVRYHAPAPSHRPGDGSGIVFSTDELGFDFIIESKRNDESKSDDPGWWSQTGSNRRPPACKAGALPTELWPRQRTEDG